MRTTVTTGGKTSIPVELRKKYSVRDHTKLLWIDDGTALRILPIPEDPIAFLQGKVQREEYDKSFFRSKANRKIS